jgi:hypothetical protein
LRLSHAQEEESRMSVPDTSVQDYAKMGQLVQTDNLVANPDRVKVDVFLENFFREGPVPGHQRMEKLFHACAQEYYGNGVTDSFTLVGDFLGRLRDSMAFAEKDVAKYSKNVDDPKFWAARAEYNLLNTLVTAAELLQSKIAKLKFKEK